MCTYFSVYIDGARFLPDNVSISCVEAFATDSSNNVYGKVTADVDPRARAVSWYMLSCGTIRFMCLLRKVTCAVSR